MCLKVVVQIIARIHIRKLGKTGTLCYSEARAGSKEPNSTYKMIYILFSIFLSYARKVFNTVFSWIPVLLIHMDPQDLYTGMESQIH